MADCNTCEKKKEVQDIPYIVHESAMARQERHIKRLWIALIISVFLVFASNVGWLIYESQYDTISYSQDGEGINNINTGDQGDVLNGAEAQGEGEEEGQR